MFSHLSHTHTHTHTESRPASWLHHKYNNNRWLHHVRFWREASADGKCNGYGCNVFVFLSSSSFLSVSRRSWMKSRGSSIAEVWLQPAEVSLRRSTGDIFSYLDSSVCVKTPDFFPFFILIFNFLKLVNICNEKEAGRRGVGPAALIWMSPVSDQERTQRTEPAPTWRRNPKRPQGLDGKRRTVNFTSWPKCCLYRRPSRPSWTKRPSYGWPPATWRWESFSLRVSDDTALPVCLLHWSSNYPYIYIFSLTPKIIIFVF